MNVITRDYRQSAVELNRLRNSLRDMLDRYEFTHFVSLALNAPGTSNQGALGRLRDWDARTCRKLIGPKWVDRPDERPVWFAFLESPGVNPHWHLMVDAASPERSDGSEKWSSQDFMDYAGAVWTRLVSSGTIDVKRVTSADVNTYATKSLNNAECFENFVTSLEFIR